MLYFDSLIVVLLWELCLCQKIEFKSLSPQNSLIVGSSPSFNCSDTLSNIDFNLATTSGHRAPRPIQGRVKLKLLDTDFVNLRIKTVKPEQRIHANANKPL